MIKKRLAPSINIAAASAWDDAPLEFTKRCVFMDIYGDTGTGRTSLALSAPGPIAFAHTAEKIDGIIQRWAREKPIKVHNFAGTFHGSAQAIANQAAPTWNKLFELWQGIYGWARTGVLDTGNEAWELLRLARFGELNPKGRTDSLYGPVNAEWRSMFKPYKTQERCSIITIHQTKDEYVKGKGANSMGERTGNTIRTGMKEMQFMADVVVRTSKEDGIFKAQIQKGWMNAHTEGMEFESADLTSGDISFSKIMALITETDESEWQ